jgi:hypothetical protein
VSKFIEIERSKNNFLFYRLSNPNVEFLDWKIPENRIELFNRYFKWRVLSNDLDHTHYCKTLCENYNFEEKAWFSLLFGMTYRTPQAFAYSETFRNIHEFNIKEIENWNSKNWKRTTYGTDARYNKGHFSKQVESIKSWLGKDTFESKFNKILVYDNEKANFKALYSEILSLYKYGRMTGWITMQALHDLLDLPIDPNDIMLDGYSPNNDSSLQSIWNGLCFYTNNTNKLVGKYGNYVCEEKDILWAKELLMEYTSKAEIFSGFRIDSFRKESIWCQYKRLFNENGSKEYPGHSSGDAVSRYLYYRENWPEIDWSRFRKALRDQPGYIKGCVYNNWYNSIFGELGLLLNMNELYDDMPNVYDIIEEDINKNIVKELWTDDNIEVPYIKNNSSTFKTDILTTPKWINPL